MADLDIQLAVLQSIVQQGFNGVNERLDKLNGRVYNGERDGADARERLRVLEALREEEDRKPEPNSTAKVATVAGGAAAGVLGVLESIRALVQYLQGP